MNTLKDLNDMCQAGHEPPDTGEFVAGPGYIDPESELGAEPEGEEPPGQGDEGARRAEKPQRKHATTPDGRPYLVKVPGGTIWFVATETGFAAVDAALARSELERHWPKLVTTKPAGKSERPMDLPELFERYGARADRLIYSYIGEGSRYIYGPEHGGELHLRVAFDAPPTAVRHEDVLEWLEIAFNERVLDWLATLPLVDRPTAVLILLGVAGIGKSMLALGAARYFGRGIADYDDVFKGRFNGALLRSPVVHCDEMTEVDARSGGFRKLAANTTHAVEEKNRPTATLIGCPRIVVSSNNPDPLKLGREELTQADEEAIGRRILLVDCNEAAARLLEAHGGRAYTRDWIEYPDGRPGKLPETIAWLVQNRKVERGGRFLVAGDAAEWAARVGTRSGLPATILDAMAAWYERDSARKRKLGSSYQPAWPAPFLRDANYPESVLAFNTALRERWSAMFKEQRTPTHNAVTEALKRLAPKGRERLTISLKDSDDKPMRPWGFVVPLSMLADRLDDEDDEPEGER